MRKILLVAALAALVAGGAATASAQGRSGEHGSGNGRGNSSYTYGQRGLDRADVRAGTHGAKGRAKARARGANAFGFCPPGQAKKSGNGSRFQC
jgi:hypothetical protein